jgi:hypothetical protein
MGDEIKIDLEEIEYELDQSGSGYDPVGKFL